MIPSYFSGSLRGAGVGAVVLAVPLFLVGCGSAEAPPADPPVTALPTSSTTAPSPSSTGTDSPAGTASPTATPVETAVFTTPDGAYSFQHPTDWTVNPDPTMDNQYLVSAEGGTQVAILSTGRAEGPLASPAYPAASEHTAEVPGLAEPLGRTVTAVMGIYLGQAPASESIMYVLADGGDPAANAGRVKAADGTYLSFSGSFDISNGSTSLSEEEQDARLEEYVSSERGQAVLAMLSSLSVDPAVVTSVATACQGANYVYTDLQGLSCDEAQTLVAEVIADGRPEGVHSIQTERYYCAGHGAASDGPGVAAYACGVLPIDTAGTRVSVDPLQDDHPLLHVGSGAGAEAASVDCDGMNYEFTEVQGLSCDEAKGMLDPFLQGKATPTGEFGRVFGDAECTAAPKQRNGTMVPSWSCTRADGGSFVAYSKKGFGE